MYVETTWCSICLSKKSDTCNLVVLTTQCLQQLMVDSSTHTRVVYIVWLTNVCAHWSIYGACQGGTTVTHSTCSTSTSNISSTRIAMINSADVFMVTAHISCNSASMIYICFGAHRVRCCFWLKIHTPRYHHVSLCVYTALQFFCFYALWSSAAIVVQLQW